MPRKCKDERAIFQALANAIGVLLLIFLFYKALRYQFKKDQSERDRLAKLSPELQAAHRKILGYQQILVVIALVNFRLSEINSVKYYIICFVIVIVTFDSQLTKLWDKIQGR